ncbi:hypothetical protein U1Q18_050366, partial [Sarracenia purpurea var. burkii]
EGKPKYIIELIKRLEVKCSENANVKASDINVLQISSSKAPKTSVKIDVDIEELIDEIEDGILNDEEETATASTSATSAATKARRKSCILSSYYSGSGRVYIRLCGREL